MTTHPYPREPRNTVLTVITLALAFLLASCGASYRPDTAKGKEGQTLTHQQLVEIGNALAQRGDMVRAEQYWMRAIEQGADARKVLPLLLATYVRDRQYRLAIQRAEDHLRRHPRDVDLRLLLGSLHEAIGGYHQAVNHYERVVERRPAEADGHYALASVLLQQGHDRSRADAHFRRYLELDPHGPYADRARGALLKEIER